MIDWISVSIPLKHTPIKSGHYLMFDEEGEILANNTVRKLFKGSYDTKIAIRSQGHFDNNGQCTTLYLSGNPSKYLQGHNVFGNENLIHLLQGIFLDITKRYDLGINKLEIISAVNAGTVSRIDFTKSLQFDNRLQARSYIKQLSLLAHTRSGRPMQKKWTLAFQPSSKRWNLIVYSKGDEIETNKLHQDFEHKEFIQNEANSLVRVELRFKSLELLDLNLRKVHQLTPTKLNELYEEYINRVNMSNKLEVSDEFLQKLPRTIKASYLMWKSGLDIQAEMTERTYYRHLSEIRKIGVDISIPYQESSVNNVVPLKTVINAKPYITPKEAYEKGLVFKQANLTLV